VTQLDVVEVRWKYHSTIPLNTDQQLHDFATILGNLAQKPKKAATLGVQEVTFYEGCIPKSAVEYLSTLFLRNIVTRKLSASKNCGLFFFFGFLRGTPLVNLVSARTSAFFLLCAFSVYIPFITVAGKAVLSQLQYLYTILG